MMLKAICCCFTSAQNSNHVVPLNQIDEPEQISLQTLRIREVISNIFLFLYPTEQRGVASLNKEVQNIADKIINQNPIQGIQRSIKAICKCPIIAEEEFLMPPNIYTFLTSPINDESKTNQKIMDEYDLVLFHRHPQHYSYLIKFSSKNSLKGYPLIDLNNLNYNIIFSHADSFNVETNSKWIFVPKSQTPKINLQFKYFCTSQAINKMGF